jgi:uncharacterized membrane protein
MDWFGRILEQVLPFFEQVPIVRAALGTILVLFLPGFAWTLVFFKQIKVVERIAFSFGLSIVMVTLIILVLNVLLGVSITGLSSLLIIIAIILVPIFLYLFRRLTKRANNGESV